MKEYPKIQTLFKRDDNKRIILGEWTTLEFQYLRDTIWEFTEKVDGTNCRIHWDGKERKIGGRTDAAQMPIYLYERLVELFPESKLAKVFPLKEGEPLDVTLYGEGYGRKIQKVGSLYNPSGVDFVLFDIRIGHWWLTLANVWKLAKELEIKPIPVVGSGTLQDAVDKVKNGFTSTWGDFPAEGIVARPGIDLLARNGERIICKIKSKDFKF